MNRAVVNMVNGSKISNLALHAKIVNISFFFSADSDTDEILSSGFSILPSTSSTAKGLTMPHCDICGLTFTAMSQAKMHLSGARHAKKLRQLNLSAKEEIAVPSGNFIEAVEGEGAGRWQSG